MSSSTYRSVGVVWDTNGSPQQLPNSADAITINRDGLISGKTDPATGGGIFAGIAPSSAPTFVVAQLVGGALAILLLRMLYPDVLAEQAENVVLSHPAADHTVSSRGRAVPPGP